jgi:hypothetical protein
MTIPQQHYKRNLMSGCQKPLGRFNDGAINPVAPFFERDAAV